MYTDASHGVEGPEPKLKVIAQIVVIASFQIVLVCLKRPIHLALNSSKLYIVFGSSVFHSLAVRIRKKETKCFVRKGGISMTL